MTSLDGICYSHPLTAKVINNNGQRVIMINKKFLPFRKRNVSLKILPFETWTPGIGSTLFLSTTKLSLIVNNKVRMKNKSNHNIIYLSKNHTDLHIKQLPLWTISLLSLHVSLPINSTDHHYQFTEPSAYLHAILTSNYWTSSKIEKGAPNDQTSDTVRCQERWTMPDLFYSCGQLGYRQIHYTVNIANF